MSKFAVRCSLFACILVSGCSDYSVDTTPTSTPIQAATVQVADAGSDSAIASEASRPSTLDFTDTMFAVCGNYNFNVWCGTNHTGTSLEFQCSTIRDASMTANPRLMLSGNVQFPCDVVSCVYVCSSS